MVKIWSLIILLFLLLGLHGLKAQDAVKDTLADKSFGELDALFFNNLNTNFSVAEKIANTYLNKAKNRNDTIRIASSYYNFAVLNDSDSYNGLTYSDSIILLTKNINHKVYPGLGYLLKGNYHYRLENYDKAVEFLLIANELAVKSENVLQQIGVRGIIAAVKTSVGDYSGALKIQKERLDLLSNNSEYIDNEDYIYILEGLSLNYFYLRELDSARLYTKKGIHESLKNKDTVYYFNFLSTYGAVEFYDKNYKKALDTLKKVIPHIDGYNLATSYYFMQKSYEEMSLEEEAISMALKVDSLTTLIKDPFPELRNTYVYLIDYYREQNNLSKQIEFIDKVIELDDILVDKTPLNIEIVKKYDTPYLLNEKEKVIKKLESKNKSTKLIVIGLIISAGFLIALVIIYKKRQRTYLKRYQELLDKNSEEQKIKKISETEKLTSGIAQPVFDEICNAIENFEKEKGFLDSKLTLNSLAKELDTNTAYLSKVINVSRGMNFSNYLHTMRIEYIIEQLKVDHKLRKYTIKAIAYEAGYASTESFSKSFYRITGVYPSYFVKKLNEEIKQTV